MQFQQNKLKYNSIVQYNSAAVLTLYKFWGEKKFYLLVTLVSFTMTRCGQNTIKKEYDGKFLGAVNH